MTLQLSRAEARTAQDVPKHMNGGKHDAVAVPNANPNRSQRKGASDQGQQRWMRTRNELMETRASLTCDWGLEILLFHYGGSSALLRTEQELPASTWRASLAISLPLCPFTGKDTHATRGTAS